MSETKNPQETPQEQTPATAVGFGDKSVELSLFDRYKGAKNRTDRIAVISRSLLRGNSHWYNNRTFRCLTEKEDQPALCCEKLGAPMQKFAMLVFHYEADKAGQIEDETKCKGTLKIWVLTESRYQELSNIHKQWPLLNSGFSGSQHDMIILCSEEQFQRMTFETAAESHWKKKENWFQTLERRGEKAKDSLAKSLGKKLTLAEIKEVLGVAVPQAPPTAGPGDIDLGDVLETSAAPVSLPAPTAAVDKDDIPF